LLPVLDAAPPRDGGGLGGGKEVFALPVLAISATANGHNGHSGRNGNGYHAGHGHHGNGRDGGSQPAVERAELALPVLN
jgi:hypothetical protein